MRISPDPHPLKLLTYCAVTGVGPFPANLTALNPHFRGSLWPPRDHGSFREEDLPESTIASFLLPTCLQ